MMFDPIRMHGILRYANRVRIKDEDLAQHSFSVAYYCYPICKAFDIPDEVRNEAIAMAIIHDIGECFTSDLPHDVKTENSELKELCDKLERKYIDQISEIKDTWHKLEDNKDSVVSIVVKLGDALSVKSYAEREILLGNKTIEMKTISDEVEERIDKLVEKLKRRLEDEENERKSTNSDT